MPTPFYAIVLRLWVAEDSTLPETHGRYALAAFLDLVRQTNPDLAETLHNPAQSKPFALSPLMGLPAPKQGFFHLRAGQEAWLRLTLAGETLYHAVLHSLLATPAHAPVMRLGKTPLALREATSTPGSHPAAGFTTAEALLENAPPHPTLTLELLTPTSFSLGDKRVELLPRSELVFGNLLKKWPAWAGQPFPVALERDWLRENVLVTDWWNIHRETLHFGPRHTQVGTVGTVVYQPFAYQPDLLRALNALANFANFAGVGRKTTHGMGQVRRVVPSP